MVKLFKNLPVLLLVVITAWLLYTYSGTVLDATATVVNSATHTLKHTLGLAEDEHNEMGVMGGDAGMYDSPNPNAFGTTEEAERRITNDGVRKEFHVNPFPWAECTCDSGACDKHGVPNPAPGHTHVCKYGFPSKRIVDMNGGHFQLNHICTMSNNNNCSGDEPAILGRWWSRNCGCNGESYGLDIRPLCSRCK